MKLDREGIDKMDEVEIQKQLLIYTVKNGEKLDGVRRVLNFFLIMTILSVMVMIADSSLSTV